MVWGLDLFLRAGLLTFSGCAPCLREKEARLRILPRIQPFLGVFEALLERPKSGSGVS
jgi:hypothetical protein